MMQIKTNKNIVLIGFMGSGKSTVGAELSTLLSCSLIETDAEIVRIMQMEISGIFRDYGEAFFRKKEAEVCKLVAQMHRTVISTGGGILKNPDNIMALRKTGIIFYLKADAEHIYNNLKNDNTRPLLQSKTAEEKKQCIRDLIAERAPLYEKSSDVQIDVNDKNIKKISEEIFGIYKEDLHDFSR